MLNFREIEIEGFGSFQIPFTFKLDHPGLTVIKAPNGTGKTTILSALSWVCTGYPLKEGATIETWEHLRTKIWRGTKVRVAFEKNGTDYEVIRCKEFTGKVNGAKGKNRLILMKNGQEIAEAKSKGAAKELLIEILGFSYNLFKSALAMGQKVKGLVEEDNSSRVKIFEEAFNVAYINKARDIGKQKVKNERDKVQKLGSELSKLESKIEGKEELLEELTQQRDNFTKDKKAKVLKYKSKLKKVRSKLTKIKGTTDKENDSGKIIILKAHIKSIKKGKEEAHKLEIKITKKKSSYKYLEKNCHNLECDLIEANTKLADMPTTCFECGKEYTKQELKLRSKVVKANQKAAENAHKAAKGELDTLKTEIDYLSQQLTSKNESYTELNSLETKLKKLEKKRDKANSKKKLKEEYQAQEQEILEELSEVKKSKFTGDPEKVEKQLEKLASEKKPIKKLYRRASRKLEALQWCIDDPLSNSGIKAFIFDQMMEDFNELLLEYADILGFQVRFEVNMESARKSIEAYILRGGSEIPQKDLSGGQGQLVNIAAAFALHDVVNKVLNTNILFIDEAFESLDSNNIELVSEIIQKKADTKSVTLITHQKAFAPTNARMMALRLHQGVTQYDRP